LEKLKDFAEKTDFKIKLDPIRIKAKLAEGDKEHNIEGVNIAHLPDVRYATWIRTSTSTDDTAVQPTLLSSNPSTTMKQTIAILFERSCD